MKLCDADIWTIPLDEPPGAILSADEAARAARFRFERDRVHWTAARSALRRILAKYVECAPENIVFVYGEHGKPALSGGGPEFNLSHAGGHAMVAVSRLACLGVDLEAVRDNVDMAKLLARMGEENLPDDRTALFQRWTEREARTKAAGSPLLQRPGANVIAVPLVAPKGLVASVAMVNAMPVPHYCGGL